MWRTMPNRIATAALICGCATLFLLQMPPNQSRAQTVIESPSPAVTLLLPVPSPIPPAWAAFESAWTNITGYSTTITVFERNGTQLQNWVVDYTFHKPSSATLHFDAGPNAGVTIVWNGGDTVVAHRGSGLMALFKKTFSLHDPTVTTIRGSSIDQLSFGAILAHAKTTPGPISQAPGPVIDGVPTEVVTLVPTSSAANTGLSRETVDISTTTHLPVRVRGYDKDETLVRQIDFSNVKLEN
jgi:outer membrane lipoprotein-sorting protein